MRLATLPTNLRPNASHLQQQKPTKIPTKVSTNSQPYFGPKASDIIAYCCKTKGFQSVHPNFDTMHPMYKKKNVSQIPPTVSIKLQLAFNQTPTRCIRAVHCCATHNFSNSSTQASTRCILYTKTSSASSHLKFQPNLNTTRTKSRSTASHTTVYCCKTYGLWNTNHRSAKRIQYTQTSSVRFQPRFQSTPNQLSTKFRQHATCVAAYCCNTNGCSAKPNLCSIYKKVRPNVNQSFSEGSTTLQQNSDTMRSTTLHLVKKPMVLAISPVELQPNVSCKQTKHIDPDSSKFQLPLHQISDRMLPI